MSKFDKLVEKLLRGTSDANFAFDDMQYLLFRLGFDLRIHGSHHVFRRRTVPPKRVVLQPDGKNTKPYQVAQVRDVVRAILTRERNDG